MLARQFENELQTTKFRRLHIIAIKYHWKLLKTEENAVYSFAVTKNVEIVYKNVAELVISVFLITDINN